MVTPIKIRRIELGMKQKDLVAIVGITPQYMMHIENGKAKNPSVNVMKRLADTLNSSVQELFFETEAATSNQCKQASEGN